MQSFLEPDWQFPESTEWRQRSFDALKSSMETFKDGTPLFEMLKLGGELNLNEKAKEVLSWDSTARVLEVWLGALKDSSVEYITAEDVDTFTGLVKEKAEVKGKHLFMPLRVASIGKAQGTEIKDLIPLIPRTELIQRAENLMKTPPELWKLEQEFN